MKCKSIGEKDLARNPKLGRFKHRPRMEGGPKNKNCRTNKIEDAQLYGLGGRRALDLAIGLERTASQNHSCLLESEIQIGIE